MAWIISRMRGAGCVHGMEKRFVMCGLIWLPIPSMNRPLVSSWRSLATTASVIGLRAKATVMPVPKSSLSVAVAPTAMGRNGSWLVSADHTPSYPLASALAACSAMPVGSNPMPPSIFMCGLPSVPSASDPCSLLLLTPQEALELRSDLVARGHGVDPHRVPLGGIDALLEFAHHGLVLDVVGDQLVHLPPGAVTGAA